MMPERVKVPVPTLVKVLVLPPVMMPDKVVLVFSLPAV